MGMRNPRTYKVFIDALQRNPQWHWIIELINRQDEHRFDESSLTVTDMIPTDFVDGNLEAARMEWAKEKEELMRRQWLLERRLQEIALNDTPNGLSYTSECEDISNKEDDVDELDLPGSVWSRNYSFKSARSDTLSRSSSATRLSFGRSFISGKIRLLISYNRETSMLELVIAECKGLRPVDKRHRRLDPYVKSYILPDEHKVSKRKTGVIKNNLNPVFMERVQYKLSFADVEAYTLRISVWHKVKFGRNRFLGEVVIPLEEGVLEFATDEWYFLGKPLR